MGEQVPAEYRRSQSPIAMPMENRAPSDPRCQRSPSASLRPPVIGMGEQRLCFESRVGAGIHAAWIAWVGVQAVMSRIIALAIVSSFRATATNATLEALPASRNRL